MDALVTFVVAIAVAVFFLRRYLNDQRKGEELARGIAEKARLLAEPPKGLHPHIDITHCIGCATCTTVCPEGDVLTMLGGKIVYAAGPYAPLEQKRPSQSPNERLSSTNLPEAESRDCVRAIACGPLRMGLFGCTFLFST